MTRNRASILSASVATALVLLQLPVTQVLAQSTSFPEDATNQGRNVFTASKQYLVYVPDPKMLPQVKSVAPEAFSGRLDSGQKVVQIGRFNNLNFAQRRVDQLKQVGLGAEILTVPTKIASSMPVGESYIPVVPPVTNTTVSPVTPTSAPPADSFTTLPGVPGNATVAQQTIEISRPASPAPTSIPITSSSSALPAPVTPAPVTVIPALPTNTRNRYFVIIPSSAETVLQKVRNIAPSARLAASERGTYIEVQGFPDRTSADTLTATVRSQGLDARVIYF